MRHDHHGRGGRRLGTIQVAALVALLAVVACAAAAAVVVWRGDHAERERSLTARAAVALQHEVDEAGLALLGVRGLLDAGGTVTGERFARYVEPVLQGSRMVGLSWLPRVPGSSRRAFERRNGVTVVDTVTSAVSATGLRASPRRPVHYPFLHIAATPGIDALPGLPGLDVLGYPGQAAGIAAARRSGRPTLVSLTPTPQGPMVGLYAAVYERGETPGPEAAVRGFVSAGFMLEDVTAPMREVLPDGARVWILDGGRQVYGSSDPPSGASLTGPVAGRSWTLRVSTAPSTGGLAVASLILIGGVVITAFVALLFSQGNRREHESGRVAAEQAALRRVATTAASAPGDVVSLVAREAAELLGADMGLVCRFDAGRAHTVGSWGERERVAPPSLPLRGGGVLAQVATTGRSARLEDYATLPPDDPIARSEWVGAVASAIAAPVRVGSDLWGAVVVAHHERRPWDAGAEDQLGRLADLAAAAIASAEARRALALQATTDPLTGLANRRTFDERLAAEQARAERSGSPLALVLADIDHFKAVNDRFGHQAGDRVLVEIAHRLRASARPHDLVARIGGEEIAWLMADTDARGACDAAERARLRISGSPFAGVGRVTVSAGVCDLEGALTAGGLVRGADLALYRAKGDGRDRVAVCTGEGAAGPGPAPAVGAIPLGARA